MEAERGKSKLDAGLPKNSTVVFEAAGDSIKVTIDGTAPDGKPTHNEWTGKLDGKDYPVTGDPTSDARSYKQIDDHRLAFTIKKDAKTTISGRVVVSADGRPEKIVAYLRKITPRVDFRCLPFDVTVEAGISGSKPPESCP